MYNAINDEVISRPLIHILVPTYSVTYKNFTFCALLLLFYPLHTQHCQVSTWQYLVDGSQILKMYISNEQIPVWFKMQPNYTVNIATFCVGNMPATCLKLPWFTCRPIILETTSIVLYVCKGFHQSRNSPAAITTRCSPAKAEIGRARKCSSESLTPGLLDSDSTRQRPDSLNPESNLANFIDIDWVK
jgi:hypothetical protein